MSRCNNWEAVVTKFTSKLSLWKARLLSVGGRLSLIKSVLGNLPTYFMSLYYMPAAIRSKLESLRQNFFIGSELGDRKMAWVSWNTCLASKELGGLGIGSIHALNVGLLFKWIWRFLHNQSDLWISVIKGIYGCSGGIFGENFARSCHSPWSGILSMIKKLKHKGIDLVALYSHKNYCVAHRLPPHEWNTVLRRDPRGGIEASQFNELRLHIESVVLNSNPDSWSWTPNIHKGFTLPRLLVMDSKYSQGFHGCLGSAFG
ncbi:RNA-directed DNA polymerase, eukaryota, Reverse transcriptase zinc-binding domain protein [Artemisia annua]|uniref:RNA-directed DNA polymerase, eukaryota, Reverse transcriptase zinc-binding domain protein n=1 Tax=Artemisia annua TaxID=35608 RepID=A0A2U1N0V3_ARTAN|nr:RNA-directed DNA polymerase, eukaryota, Reverse transcriptase zinc-binding domain protein [Artemisia annua]